MEKIDKYMMATKAFHKLGDISRDEEDICYVHEERDDGYVGAWVTGFGFIEVFFPKDTTRELTSEETEKYNEMYFQIASQPPFKLNIREENERRKA